MAAPHRHPIAWREEAFQQEDALHQECARVFDVCHGCRRCVNLCQAFPTLFDLIDHSADMEVSGVDAADYHKVAEQCYLCDLCFMSKCPYVPPHEWAIDFPALMLRAKAVAFRQKRVGWRDRQLAEVDRNGRLGGIPVLNQLANKAMHYAWARDLLGIHRDAVLPAYQLRSVAKSVYRRQGKKADPPRPGSCTSGRVAVFLTCYGRCHDAQPAEDLMQVLEHNGIHVEVIPSKRCCGMPKLELGDLESIHRSKPKHLASLLPAVDKGFDLIASVPSCVLMFRAVFPLLYPDDEEVKLVSQHLYDPSEYLMLRHADGLLNTDFKNSLGKVVYHLACHTRVQNVGYKTRDLLTLVPGTTIQLIERCSGHDGTYGVKRASYPHARRIGGPPAQRLRQAKADCFASDCVLAGKHLAELADAGLSSKHPFSLLKHAYGL